MIELLTPEGSRVSLDCSALAWILSDQLVEEQLCPTNFLNYLELKIFCYCYPSSNL